MNYLQSYDCDHQILNSLFYIIKLCKGKKTLNVSSKQVLELLKITHNRKWI